jgi:hypothetical protein
VTDERSAVETLTGWLRNEAERRAFGEVAKEVVRDGLGAAERSTKLVEGLLVV